MAKDASLLSIELAGPLRVTGPGGDCLTPLGAKNQAVLALLVLSPGMTRPRRWLEDKLWSTFGPEQASANLRQSLSKLRRTLGAFDSVLSADRNTVSLDAARIHADVLENDFRIDDAHELLEGIDVRDPEFEDWLRAERSRFAARLEAAMPSIPTGLLIQCRTDAHGGGMNEVLGEIIANRIGENIAEQVRAWRQSGRHVDAGTNDHGDLEISCDLLETDGSLNAFVKVVHAPSARILYSKLQNVPSAEAVMGSHPGLSAVIFEAADRTLGRLPLAIANARPEARATALARLALYRMFTFQPDALREADSLLRQAYEVDRNGIYTAWRALIRNIQLIELLEPDVAALREESVTLNQHALEQGADNALVQALVSQVRVMALGDAAGGVDLAEQSVERNPAGGFGWLSLAVARMLAGEPRKAFEVSQHARSIARFSPFRHWWDLYHCIVSVACNQPHLAIEAGEAAARAAPAFRPAHRHLLALYALDGQHDKALAVAGKLAKIEPGFTLDRFVNDEAYPVRTLRSNGLLEPIRALL
ncbi:AfsR/SARP family transcriptional regulator [Salipiger sp.]|uniref:AfsR/SARP family transcriptional regulator n=1 Tax=Salipiger sp. TaxID=2078585 RepID=UPI003A98699E